MTKHTGILTVKLTASTITEQIAETREKIDEWLSTFTVPGKGLDKVQNLKLLSLSPLRYELFLAPRISTEAKGIL